ELRSWIGAETEKVSKPEKEGRDKSPAPNSPSESAVSLSVPPVLVLDDFAAMFRLPRDEVLIAETEDPVDEDENEETGD
ncbi:MAG: hypothetical protein LBU19_03670, partial [Treponema sp.]|nr:hypothetical protein [Treponema sp.]